MSLSEKEVEHIAKLGRLAVTEDEITELSKNLNQILDYAGTLQELDTSKVEPMTGAIELSHVIREDLVKKDFDKEVFLENAPDSEGSAIKVPKMS